MNSAEKINRIAELSPKNMARLAGVFSLLTILGGIFAQGFISQSLVVDGDAAATAANILNNESLFWLGFAVYLVEMGCQIAMTTFYYELFKPVSRSQSLLSAWFSLSGCVIKTFSRLFFIAPLFVLGNASYLKVFNTEQLQALALLFLKVNDYGAGIALIFFGVSTIIRGFLILKSTFLPRFLGVLGIIAGLGWLSFIYPPLGYRLFTFIALAGLIGSAVQIFWLLVYGVNEKRWLEQADAARESIWK
jgi:hypothetical protein